MLSCQQTQNVIDGKKRVILNPSEVQKRDFDAATFAENEVYGIDILISSGEDGKVGSQSEADSPIFIGPLRALLVSRGGVPYNDLSEGFNGHISTQNENFSSRVFRGAKESRHFPLQHTIP
jgi:hypothetical protein